MKRTIILFSLLCAFVFFIGCSKSNDQTGNNSKGMIPTVAESQSSKRESNAISQSLPTLMVIPSDGLLQQIGYLSSIDNQGMTSYVRDYNGALINNSDLKFVIAAIEEEFANVGYPLENLEQQLKMIGNENAMDEAEGIARDLRAELMNTARPDYIIEIEYEMKVDSKSRNLSKSLTYIVKCLDVYTNKAIAAITRADVGKDGDNVDLAPIIKQDFPETIGQLQGTISSHYADQLANGAEVSFRVVVLQESGIAMDDDCGSDEIGEQVINWLKENSINSTYKMVKNTSTEMRFTNVRMYTQDENGNSYTAYDFAKDLKDALEDGCGLDVANKTQSIGDSYLQIEGVK